MPEERPTITSSARINPTEIGRHSFAIIRRGFDPQEVRNFLDQIAREFESFERREQDLRQEIVEAQRRAEHPVLDEATLASGLGQQSAQILRNAHEEAARIVSQAEDGAAQLLRDAQQAANDVQIRAESAAAERVAEAELSVGVVQQQTQEASEALLNDTRTQASALVEESRAQGREMLEQAQLARKRILTDLARRRRTLLIQIEQFRAARDEISAMVLNVRDSFDTVINELARADENARVAAASAGERAKVELPEVQVGEDEGGAPESVAEPLLDDAAIPAPPPPPVLAFDAVAPDDLPDDSSELASVDELFARIRASHGNGEISLPIAGEQGHGGISLPVTGEQPAVAPVVADEPFGSQGVRVVQSTTVLVQELPANSGEDKLAVEARAQLLDPVTARLAKRLKRALQDDQNRLLDNIRGASSELLVGEDEQRTFFQEASRELLIEAVAAGIGAAREKKGGVTPKMPAGTDVKIAETMSGELAGVLVTMLRRPLAETTVLSGDDEELIERVSAAYREWRGERVERLVGDFTVGAFSAGVLAGTGARRSVRWVHSGEGDACADCDDNSLAGSVRPGEDFPTGHQHPPAHAGCRCLVVPTPS
jgi:DivIVA domain-containing protein